MSIERSVQIGATPERVWNVLLEARWLGTTVVETTWEVGTPLAFVRTTDARQYRDKGTVLACDPPRLVQWETWSPVTRLRDTPENRARVTIALEPSDGGTRVTVTHEPPPAVAAGEHARWFWGVALAQLQKLSES